MRESQYINGYLNAAHIGVNGNMTNYAINTYLAYELRGKARKWSGRYRDALENAINRRIKAKTVVRVPSIMGRVAYAHSNIMTDILLVGHLMFE